MVKWTTAMRSRSLRLSRMASAAARAMATRLPLDIEPEASSTRVTLSGVSSGSRGAWKAMRTRRRWLSSGCRAAALVMPKLRPSGTSYS